MPKIYHKWEYHDFENNIDVCLICGITRHRELMKLKRRWFSKYKVDGIMVDKAPDCIRPQFVTPPLVKTGDCPSPVPAA